MRPLSIEPVTSLDKCRVTFYWVIKCTLRNTTQWVRGALHNLYRHYVKIKKNGYMVIGRGRPREYPKDTSEGVTWPSVTMGVAQLLVVHAHTQGNPEGVKWPWVSCGSHGTTVLLLRKKRGLKPGMRRTYFRSWPLPDRDSSCHVTLSLSLKMPH
jgi:hypothetical protein